jgi:hypothetical protein
LIIFAFANLFSGGSMQEEASKNITSPALHLYAKCVTPKQVDHCTYQYLIFLFGKSQAIKVEFQT